MSRTAVTNEFRRLVDRCEEARDNKDGDQAEAEADAELARFCIDNAREIVAG